MIKGIKRKIFHNIHHRNLVYNTCWEDPRCDRELLGLNAASQVVMITSAGCNALDYLLDGPASIHCVDMNPRQNALLELKSCLLKHYEHELLFRFFGEGWHHHARQVFTESIQQHLSDYSRQYWGRNIHFFDGKGLRNSFYWYGSAGTAAYLVKQVLETSPRTKRLISEMFETENLEEQQQLYYKIEPRLINWFMRWLFNRHLFQSMLGVPQAQQLLAKKAYEEGMAGYIKVCLRKVFTEKSLSDNYFWKVYLFGRYDKTCCPNYLLASNFERLKAGVDRIQTHTSTLSQFLKTNPGKYTHFVLLDHQDWLAAHDRLALEEEWALILQNSAPKAKVLMRSAAEEINFIPEFVAEKIEFSTATCLKAQQDDRVGTYAQVQLGQLN